MEAIFARTCVSFAYIILLSCLCILRTVPRFATAHTFCASRDGPRMSDFLSAVPAKTEIFLSGL